MKKSLLVIAVIASLAVTGTELRSQTPKVPEATARATALARVKGVVKDHELETEGGKLIYSYDIAVAGKSGIDEVHIDAITGKVLSVTHETPVDEKSEKKSEQDEKKKTGSAASAEQRKLAARARISEASARTTALARVPNSTVSAFELEEEDGRLIYSYDLKVTGRKGIEEVHVDATTGKILKVEHEDS